MPNQANRSSAPRETPAEIGETIDGAFTRRTVQPRRVLDVSLRKYDQ